MSGTSRPTAPSRGFNPFLSVDSEVLAQIAIDCLPTVPPLAVKLKRVYLAGPEVFREDADAAFSALDKLCHAHGLQGVRPSSGSDCGEPAGSLVLAQHIYRINVALINSCDAVLANVAPFRNALEPDSGTVFEVGYAAAKGVPVACVVAPPAATYRERVAAVCGERPGEQGAVFDQQYGFMIEPFEHPLNLMLSCSTATFYDASEALKHLANLLASAKQE